MRLLILAGFLALDTVLVAVYLVHVVSLTLLVRAQRSRWHSLPDEDCCWTDEVGPYPPGIVSPHEEAAIIRLRAERT